MLDIGWSELLVIAIVLIVVVGPKDLPPMIRAFGKTMANLRRMGGEFRSQFDEAMREADLDDVRKTIADAKSLNPASSLREALDPLRQVGEDLKSDLRKAATPPPVMQEKPLVPESAEKPSAEAAPVVQAPAVSTNVEEAAAATDPVAAPATIANENKSGEPRKDEA